MKPVAHHSQGAYMCVAKALARWHRYEDDHNAVRAAGGLREFAEDLLARTSTAGLSELQRQLSHLADSRGRGGRRGVPVDRQAAIFAGARDLVAERLAALQQATLLDGPVAGEQPGV